MDISEVLSQVDAVSLKGIKNTEEHDEIFYEIVSPIMDDMVNKKEEKNLTKLLTILLKETFNENRYSKKEAEHLKYYIEREENNICRYEVIDFRLRFNVTRFWFAVEICLYYIAVFEDRYDNLNVPYTKSMKKIKKTYHKSMNPQKATIIKQNCIELQNDFYKK